MVCALSKLIPNAVSISLLEMLLKFCFQFRILNKAEVPVDPIDQILGLLIRKGILGLLIGKEILSLLIGKG